MAQLTSPHRSTLLQARKAYSQCANLVESRISQSALTQLLSDQIIGIGVAADWIRRAVEMSDIVYLGDRLNNSSRKESFVELMRYGFCWFGLNAVFARPALLNVLGNPQGQSEYEAFLVLYNLRSIPDGDHIASRLRTILGAQTVPRLPESPIGTNVTILDAIHRKYIPASARRGRTAKALATAASTGTIATLDLPSLLYAFRNWSVHGNALDGSFGSRPRFLTYVTLLEQVLAEVHLNTATLLRSRL